jgi:hypothetical protein
MAIADSIGSNARSGQSQASPRRKNRFVALNCAGIPGTLLEGDIWRVVVMFAHKPSKMICSISNTGIASIPSDDRDSRIGGGVARNATVCGSARAWMQDVI